MRTRDEAIATYKARQAEKAADTDRKKTPATNALILRRVMARDTRMTGLVGYDEFACRPVLLRPIPDPDRGLPNGFQPRPWEDIDDTRLAVWFQSKGYPRAKSGLANESHEVGCQRKPLPSCS